MKQKNDKKHRSNVLSRDPYKRRSEAEMLRIVKEVNSGNYFQPAIYRVLKNDSFRLAVYGTIWGNSFHEPNLSLNPLEKEQYRLIYETAFGQGTLVSFNREEMSIKQTLSGSIYPLYDSTKLNATERLHFAVLLKNFPIGISVVSEKRKKYLDSLTNLYPELLSPQYYKELITKSGNPKIDPFKFKAWRLTLSNKEFQKLIKEINESGYWQLPIIAKCDQELSDGAAFVLEANTPLRYNVAFRSCCPGDSSAFARACQNIIDAAGLGKDARIY